ncbi:nucleotidyltransferase family protein [Geomonas azotofigens]|uniref:nucleotidyltransferase family protein n=1 Tax=Geomonas azotofigens TaxID=2843196 RepID=UPI001C102144|nr:nucleotidyltransferase family protein [Geomonas azotofigens]MBU5613845.1 nucleotidyltransferase family protein [Geomonas azotofigens]
MGKNVAGIVLAAGEGRRMGRLKQSLPFRGKSMLETVVDHALASSLYRVVVVLGHGAGELVPLLETRPVTVAVNADFGAGQASSLKAGLMALTADSDAALFLLADQPLVSAETIDAIVSAYREGDAPVVAPYWQGRRGNPVLFGRETFPLLANLQGDAGARGILSRQPELVLALPVADRGILFDVDTEEDYRVLAGMQVA